MSKAVSNSAGIILAGGQSSRMQHQDKALLPLGDKRVIDYIVSNLAPQVEPLAINANRNLATYEQLGVPVLTDTFGSDAGPIAGIYTAMAWLKTQHPDTGTVFCCPADVPWFPANTVALLAEAMQANKVPVTWLCTDGQRQPLFSLWSTSLFADIERALNNGVYSPMGLIFSLANAVVTLDHCPEGQFANLNTPEDLQFAQNLLRSGTLT